MATFKKIDKNIRRKIFVEKTGFHYRLFKDLNSMSPLGVGWCPSERKVILVKSTSAKNRKIERKKKKPIDAQYLFTLGTHIAFHKQNKYKRKREAESEKRVYQSLWTPMVIAKLT